MEVIYMATNPVVRARIDDHVKAQAEAVLASIGLTVSDAFRMMMIRIAKKRRCLLSLSSPMTKLLRP